MKSLIKLVEANWDCFSAIEKELFFHGLESIEEKLVKLKEVQRTEFEKGNTETKSAEVFELIADFKDFETRTKKVWETKVEDL